MSAARRIVPLRLNSANAMRRNSTLIRPVRAACHHLYSRARAFQLARVQKELCALDQYRLVLLAARRHRSPSPRALFPSWANRFPVHSHRVFSCLYSRREIFARLYILFLYLSMAAALYLFLFPGLAGVLKLPVAVYAMLLASTGSVCSCPRLVADSRPVFSGTMADRSVHL
jgi:hypothetical protein